jgi:hypothetical protein
MTTKLPTSLLKSIAWIARVTDLAAATGAAMIGYGAGTVKDALDADADTLTAHGIAIADKVSGTTLAASGGAAMVGLKRTPAAVTAALADWLNWQAVSVLEFMTAAQRNDVQSGASTLDVSAAIQAAVDYVSALAANNRPSVFFPAGRYLIGSTIQLHDNISLVGVRRDIGYLYAFSHSSELIATGAMSAMIDFTGSNVYIGDLGLYCNNSADYGLYTHIAVGNPRKSSATFERLSITLFKKTGIHCYNMGLIKGSMLQISGQAGSECGLDISNSGDSDFDGLYINTQNPDSASTVNAPGAATVYGVGVRMRDSSGNINFRGGKIEFCRVGMLLNDIDGVNITGISFDTNRNASIHIESDNLTAAPAVTTENAGSVTSVQIVGCRFLGGSAGAQGNSAHIRVKRSRYVTITGNGFKKAGDAARDFATDTAQGPVYGVHLDQAELCTIVGNDLYGAAVTNCLRIEHATAANAQHTLGKNSVDGTESIAAGTIRTEAAYSTLVYAAGANPVAASTAKAWVRFDGNTPANGAACPIKGSYNVQSVTRNAAGDYTINFASAMATANYATLVNVRNWFGLTDAAIVGVVTAASVGVFTTSNGAQSANGDVTVAVFG